MTADRPAVARLPDGRALAYAEYGDPHGIPVLLFHGFAGSRLERHPDDSIAAELGVRVVAVDRPGMGASDRRRGRTLLDWPLDVGHLAASLGLDDLRVLGSSWGGAYALACGYAMGERIVRVGFVAGMGGWLVGPGAARHLSKESMALSAWVGRPWILRPLFARTRRQVHRHPETVIEGVLRSSPPGDVAVLEDPGVRTMLIDKTREAFRVGVAGLIDDTIAVGRPWGFRLADVGAEVLLWHGEQDADTLPEMARDVAASLPDCRPTFYEEEGHLVLLARWREILAAMAT